MAQDLKAPPLAQVRRHVDAPAAAVWGVLADGWLYANWVVGASRVRTVDLTWPATDSTLKHSFGLWPAVISDESRVLESDAGRRILIQAKGWPLGEARVQLTVEPWDDDSCNVQMIEDAVTGPGTLVPRVIRQRAIVMRNREAVHRLALIAEGHHREWLNSAGGTSTGGMSAI